MACTVCGMAACALASHRQIAKEELHAREEYERQYGQPRSDSMTWDTAPISKTMQLVRIAKAQEVQDDLEIVAKVVCQYHPELSEAQVVSKALEVCPEWYDALVGG